MKKNVGFNFVDRRGVTLVEMAIVITVIGFLIGGIVAGKELVRQSKIDSQITQLGYFKTAIDRFKEKYGCIPGDFNEAVHVLGANHDGNCNKILDTDGFGYNEHGDFWEQLSLSKLIGENYPYVDDSCGAVSGVQCPAAKYGHDTKIMALNSSISGGGATYAAGNALDIEEFGGPNFEPWAAKAIDIKMDDGMPHYGSIISWGFAGCTVDDKNYDLTQGDMKICKFAYFFETPTSNWP